MNIYFIIRNFDGIGGTQSFARMLAEEFFEKGHKVKILTTRDRENKAKFSTSNEIPVIQFLIPEIRIIGTTIYYFIIFFHLLFNYKRYDIIQVFFLKHSAVISVIAGKILNKKVICRTECAGTYGDISSLKQTKFSSLLLFIIKKSDVIVAISKEIEKELLASGFNYQKIIFIPNAIDIKKFHPSFEKKESLKEYYKCKGKKVIVFIGRFTEQKGIEYLLEAFAALKRPDVILFLIGDGYLKQNLIDKVKFLNITHSVYFTGKKNDVVPFLQMADLFVLPSIEEGLSIALLEAMACGLPVVATKVSGSVDVIEDGINGFLVEPKNSKLLALAMDKILTNEYIAKVIGENNRNKIEHFYSIEKIGNRYLEIYCNFLKKNAK